MIRDARGAKIATRRASVRMRGILIVAAGTVVIVAAAAAAYYASQWEPPFYRAAMAMPLPVARRFSDAALHDGTVLSNHLRKPGEWQAAFSADEINGWLLVDLAENHAVSIPPPFRNPRIAITPKEIVLGCRAEWGALHTVVWLDVEPYLADSETLAVRIRKVRAGHLPLPLKQVLEIIDKGIRETNLQIRWRQTEGDPVAMVSMPPANDGNRSKIHISALRLSDGKIVIAGSTGNSKQPAPGKGNAKSAKETEKQSANSVK